MKLVRFGTSGFERPGLIDADGQLRDLSGVVDNIGAATFAPDGIKRLAGITSRSLPRVRGSPRLGVPLVGISKVIGIGLNYADHAAEAGMALPREPIIFM